MGVARRDRDAKMEQSIEHWGEGLVAGSVAPSRMGDPRFMEWAGRLERLAAARARSGASST